MYLYWYIWNIEDPFFDNLIELLIKPALNQVENAFATIPQVLKISIPRLHPLSLFKIMCLFF